MLFRSILINQKIKAILDKFTPGKKPDDYVFPILKGKEAIYTNEITTERNLFNHRLKRLGKILGISKPLHSYLARHAWANIAKEINMPVTIISESLGHSNLATTQAYLDKFESSVIDEANEMITGVLNNQGVKRTMIW